MRSAVSKVLLIFFVITLMASYALCQEDTSSSTAAPTTKGPEEEEEEPQKKGCSIWCWIQKIAMFVISQLLSKCVVCVDENTKSNYGGYQVWEAKIGSRNVSPEITDAISKKDVWRSDENSIDFLLNGTETEYWERFLNSHNISYTVVLDNVQDSIEKEDALKKRGARRVDWDSYPSLNEIDEFLKSKVQADPTHCTLKTIGKTIHNMEIKMMKVSNGKRGNTAILIETGIHGREWLAITSLLYFIEELTANFTALPGPVRHKDWYIIPLVNPDGYEYTMKKDRLWRKNRRRFSGPCDGVNIMSNFEKFFGYRGSSRDICSGEYCGPHPFSEKESIAVRDLIQGVHFTAYVSIHAYGSKLMIPWIGTGKGTQHFKTHMRVGNEIVKAINKVHGLHFRAGLVPNLAVRRTTGTPIDWAYQQEIIHSYLIETRGINYIAKTKEILPSGEEIAAGLKRLAELI